MSTPDSSAPFGYCQCGCGQKTTIPKKSNTKMNRFKGVPMRYVRGHNPIDQSYKSKPRLKTEYSEEARGYKTPCWIWSGKPTDSGHGQIRRNGKLIGVHRYYYERENGPIAPGLHLHHLCEQPSCIRPSHLQPLTPAEHAHTKKNTKLTVEKVREMRTLYASGEWSYSRLARRYDVSVRACFQAVKGERWGSV